MIFLDILRLLLAGLAFGLALLGFFRAPMGFLWKPAVAATEWGHLLALFFPFVVWLLPGGGGIASWLVMGLTALAVSLLLSSLGRALSFSKGLEARFSKAFGSVSRSSRFPGLQPGPRRWS